MTCVTHGVVIIGVEGHVIEVEVDEHNGMPGTTIVGLPDTAVGEARDRVRAATINSNCAWPQRRITVALSPAALHKRGSTLDLAIAVGILAHTNEVPLESVADLVSVGELSLDGRVRPMPGVVVAALAAIRAGKKRIAVPAANVAEARLVPDLDVIGVTSLRQLVGVLKGEVVESGDDSPRVELGVVADLLPSTDDSTPDMADVRGQAAARMAMEVAAAGGHHMAMVGPPGVGKTLLAERLPGILPPLRQHDALEVTAIHSVAGRLMGQSGLVTRAPFEAPHHTTTHVAMIGGGGHVPRTGLVSLAHRGVLFLDEAPEFNAAVLDALRQPLEAGHVVVSRAGFSLRFPAAFQLVLAANPCPCGRGTIRTQCKCSAAARLRYFSRLSGPLLDRIDIRLELQRPSKAELLMDSSAESSRIIAQRVAVARDRMAQRFRGTPWTINAHVPGHILRRDFAPQDSAVVVLSDAMERGSLSARGADRVLRVAWTIADLAACERPGSDHVAWALTYREAGEAWR